MTKREIIYKTLNNETTPYVPWSFSFTVEAEEKLDRHFGKENVQEYLGNHILELGSAIGFFEDIGNDLHKDVFGVVWDRSIDKDIGNVHNQILPEQSLDNYKFPNPHDERFFKEIPSKIEKDGDRFRVFQIGFSLFERAWSLRGGIEHFSTDFYENPDFVHELFNAIADYNIEQITKALEYDIDAVYFGDDWGQQNCLLMGYDLWKEFVYPVLKRMYGFVKQNNKFIFIHSCGKVDELFDDLIGIGLDCFNPFQPEVMDVNALLKKYNNKLTFHGGLSTQKTLPFGTVADVQKETKALIEAGKNGNYILSPSHAVEGDVSIENIIAFVDVVKNQTNYLNNQL